MLPLESKALKVIGEIAETDSNAFFSENFE